MSFRQKGTLEQAPAGLGYIKETSVLEGAIGNAAGRSSVEVTINDSKFYV